MTRAAYLVELRPPTGEPTRELVDIEDGYPELPVVLETVDRLARTITSAMDAAGATPEAEWIPWDRVLDIIEADRTNAGHLDPAGVRYPLPDGGVIEAMRLDSDTLDAATRGFVRAMLWTDAQPLPPHGVQHDGEAWRVIVNRTGRADLYPGHPTFEAAAAEAERLNAEDDDYTGESGGLENREATAELAAAARELCARFLVKAGEDAQTFMAAFGDPDGDHPGAFVGHTYYLNAAGHGVTFRDRMTHGEGPTFDAANAACERLAVLAGTFSDVEHLCAVELADGTVGL